jgi:hypothetical protein
MGKKRNRASVKRAKEKKAQRAPRIAGTLAATRQVPGPQLSPQSRLQVWKARAAKKAGLTLGLVAGAASILAVFPRFSVVPGAPLDPKDVLSTPFLVTYDGWMPLQKVTYLCSRDDVLFESRIFETQDTVQVSDAPRSLSPGDAQTASCNGEESALSPVMRMGKVRIARVAIIVRYSPLLLPFLRLHVAYPFATVSQSDGALRFVRRLD